LQTIEKQRKAIEILNRESHQKLREAQDKLFQATLDAVKVHGRPEERRKKLKEVDIILLFTGTCSPSNTLPLALTPTISG
jgi:hypothetical protein